MARGFHRVELKLADVHEELWLKVSEILSNIDVCDRLQKSPGYSQLYANLTT